MKLLLDSSSSLIFSLILAQLPVFVSATPVPHQRRPRDLDKLTNNTTNLKKLVQKLLKKPGFNSDVELRRLPSLPEMSNRLATDLHNLELKPTLSQLHADLKIYKDHFDWLSNVSKKHHRPAMPKLEKMITDMKSIITMLQHQMQRFDAPMLTPATPSLPPHLPYHYEVQESTQELLQHFNLFCDWAIRAFISLKPKVTAVQ